MPYKIAWKNRGVIWKFYGTLTEKDAIQANLDIYGDTRFDGLCYYIVDILSVDNFDITSEDLDVASFLDCAATITNPRVFVAIVAENNEAVRVAELYKLGMESSKWKVQIFDSMDDAQRWLSLACDISGDEIKDLERLCRL